MALGLFLGRHRSLGNDCLREHRSENTFVCDTSIIRLESHIGIALYAIMI